MARPCKSFYSAPISITGSLGQYYGSFGVPGEKPHWVMQDGQQAVFSSYEEAEIAGFRHLAARLNGARVLQEFRVKGTPPTRENRPAKKPFIDRRSKDINVEHVFSNFL